MDRIACPMELLVGGGGETVDKAKHTLVTSKQHEEEIREDWGKSTIISIYERREYPQDCNNSSGIGFH